MAAYHSLPLPTAEAVGKVPAVVASEPSSSIPRQLCVLGNSGFSLPAWLRFCKIWSHTYGYSCLWVYNWISCYRKLLFKRFFPRHFFKNC